MFKIIHLEKVSFEILKFAGRKMHQYYYLCVPNFIGTFTDISNLNL